MTLRLLVSRPYDVRTLHRLVDFRKIIRVFDTERVPICIDARGPADLRATLDALDAGVEIIHFDGHAVNVAGRTELVFENRARGVSERESLGVLLSHISRHRHDHPVLLCLSSCDGLSHEHQEAIAKTLGLAGVVAFCGSVASDVAAEFFQVFYEQLARCRSIGDSFAAATASMSRDLEATRRTAAEPVLVARDPTWPIFDEAERQQSSHAEVYADTIGLSGVVEIDERLGALRDKAKYLHQFLVAARARSAIAVVGAPDTGRSSLVRNVALHVAWQFRAVIGMEVHPKSAPMTDDALAHAILEKLPADARVARADDDPVDQLAIELSDGVATGILVIVEVPDRDALTADAWRMLSKTAWPSVVIAVGPPPLDSLGWQTVELSPVGFEESHNFFRAHIRVNSRKDPEVLAAVDTFFAPIYARIGGHPFSLRTHASGVRTANDVRRLANLTLPPVDEAWVSAALEELQRDPARLRVLRQFALFAGSLPRGQAVKFVGAGAEVVLQDLVARAQLYRDISQLHGDVHSDEAYSVHPMLRRTLLAAVPLSPAHEFSAFVLTSDEDDDSAGPWQSTWRASFLGWTCGLSEPQVQALSRDRLIESVIRAAERAADSHASELRARGHHALAADVSDRLADFIAHCGEGARATRYRTIAIRDLLRGGRLERAEAAAKELVRYDSAPHVQAKALGFRADIRRREGKANEARALYQRALGACRWEDDPDGVAAALRGLAEIQREAGRFSDAAVHLRNAVHLVRELPGREVALCLGLEREAYIHQILRHHARSIRLYRDVRAVLVGQGARVKEHSEHIIRALIGEADVFVNLGEFDAAERGYDEAGLLAHNIENPLLEAEAAVRLARGQARAGRPIVHAIVTVERLVKRGALPFGYRRLQLEVELAEALARSDNREAAQQLLDEVEQQGFRRMAGPIGSATLLRARGLVEERFAVAEADGAGGLPASELNEQASRTFLKAAAAYDEVQYRWRAARCRLHAIACLLRSAEASPSRVCARDAHALALNVGRAFAEMDDKLRQAYATEHIAAIKRMLEDDAGSVAAALEASHLRREFASRTVDHDPLATKMELRNEAP